MLFGVNLGTACIRIDVAASRAVRTNRGSRADSYYPIVINPVAGYVHVFISLLSGWVRCTEVEAYVIVSGQRCIYVCSSNDKVFKVVFAIYGVMISKLVVGRCAGAHIKHQGSTNILLMGFIIGINSGVGAIVKVVYMLVIVTVTTGVIGNNFVHLCMYITSVLAVAIIVCVVALVYLVYPVVVPINGNSICLVFAFYAKCCQYFRCFVGSNINGTLPVLIPQVSINIVGTRSGCYACQTGIGKSPVLVGIGSAVEFFKILGKYSLLCFFRAAVVFHVVLATGIKYHANQSQCSCYQILLHIADFNKLLRNCFDFRCKDTIFFDCLYLFDG